MKLGAFLKKVFVSKFWIKAISLVLSVFVVVLVNIC